VLCLETTTSFRNCRCCQRAEFRLSSSIRWTGRRLWEPRAWGYACLLEQEWDCQGGWYRAAGTPAILIDQVDSSVARPIRSCQSRSGMAYWSSDSSAGRGAEHQRGVCALGWDGWVACGRRIACCAGANSRACCAVLGEFPRTLEMYWLRWIVLLYFELCKVQVYNWIVLKFVLPRDTYFEQREYFICPSPI
jgi:hypothetical protein